MPSKKSQDRLELSSRNGTPAVLLSDTSKSYGRVTVVSPLSLCVYPGERVAIIGPSGAGKTTLLNLIASSTQSSSGSVHLHGEDVATLRPGQTLARLIGVIAQQFDLVPNLSVLQNVLAGRLGEWSLAKSLLSLVWPRDHQRALDALERVGVAHLAYQRAARVSGGEQQRIAIARLLVQHPRIVLADEPVASLDLPRAHEVLRLLTSVTEEQGETLIASLHDVDLARRYFARIVGLRSGRVQFDKPTSSIQDRELAKLYEIDEPTREA